jgi:hypothetical protein
MQLHDYDGLLPAMQQQQPQVRTLHVHSSITPA